MICFGSNRLVQFLLVFVAFLVALGLGAHRNKFRKCKDSRFCRTQLTRDGNEEDSGRENIRWKVRSGSVSFDANQLQLVLDVFGLRATDVPCANGVAVTISRLLEDDILRVHLTENISNRPRYLVEDVVSKQTRAATKLQTEGCGNTDGKCELSWNSDWRVEISSNPFGVVVSERNNGKDIVELNSDNLLHFECTVAAESESQPKEWWKESFDGFSYEHRHGPAAIGLDVRFANSQHVYGIPEHATGLLLEDTTGRRPADGLRQDSQKEPFRLYNLDVFEYELQVTDSLYGAIPYVTSLSPLAAAVSSVLWLNGAETFVDVSRDFSSADGDSVRTHWISESGQLELFVLLGRTPSQVLRLYYRLTGSPQLPPVFALGHHQCRWNYVSNDDVSQVSDTLSLWNAPTDVLWLDIEHTDAKRYFTWDKHHFADAKANLIDPLWAKGRRLVTIVDPHIKKDAGYYVYDEISALDLWVKDKDGADYTGWCWPGDSGYPDFVNPAMREWWAQQFAYDKYSQTTASVFTWNDMNEPSVFNGPELSMPKSCAHFGGWLHADVHNMYGYYVHKATFEGQLLRSDYKQRPFVLSRAFFAGSQRYGAVWTGDNTASWKHLRVSVPMLLSLGIAGLPFVGADIGGFFGNPSGELMARWYELAAYTPFFRNHAHQDTDRRELWKFETPFAVRMQKAIVSRYALLPYMYSVFATEGVSGGDPLMRPLWWDHVADVRLFDNDEAFLLGRALYVQGVYEEGVDAVDVQLPSKALWYDRREEVGSLMRGDSGKRQRVSGLQSTIAVLQMGGTIVPERRRVRRSTQAMKYDPFTLAIALANDGGAKGALYVDDGESHDFKLKKAYTHSLFKLDSCTLTNAVTHKGFHFHSQDASAIERLVLYGADIGRCVIRASMLGKDKKWKDCSVFVRSVSRNVAQLKLPRKCNGVRLAVDTNFQLKFHTSSGWCSS